MLLSSRRNDSSITVHTDVQRDIEHVTLGYATNVYPLLNTSSVTVRLTCDHSDVRRKGNNIKGEGKKRKRVENVTHDGKLSVVKASRATKLSPARIGLRARADVIHSMVNAAPHVPIKDS